MTKAEGKKRRLVEVDRVTGFAIVLVVVGHIVSRQPPLDNEWYVHLKFYIYQFHMPLFMFMSGLVFEHTSTPIAGLSDYLDWAVKKIARLAPGFILVGLAITLGKIFSGNFIHVDNVQNNHVDSLIRLFIQPTESAAGSLWYIYVLLEFYLIFPLLLILCRKQRVIILMIVVAMHLAHQLLKLPTIFALHDVFNFAIYFWLGAMCCTHYDRLYAFTKRWGPALFALFVASLATTSILWWEYSQTIVGLASIPAVFWLIGIKSGRLSSFFLYFSQYTFVIYLLNTIAIGLTKGVMLKILPWDAINFYLYFIVLAAAGLAMPILAQRWVFSRNTTISRIMN